MRFTNDCIQSRNQKPTEKARALRMNSRHDVGETVGYEQIGAARAGRRRRCPEGWLIEHAPHMTGEDSLQAASAGPRMRQGWW